MRAKKDSYLPGFEKATGTKHGGDLARGKRKTFRPIDPKQALHVVLRSSKARGSLSMLHPKHCNFIEEFAQKTAKRCGVRIYRFANVGNHLHLLIKVPSRAAWRRFSKELSGGIAQIVTGARKGAAVARNSGQRAFWDHLLFTRIVAFGRDFKGITLYFIKNLFEAQGVPMKKLLRQGCRVLMVEKSGLIRGAPT